MNILLKRPFEAGIALKGTEVKSLRQETGNLNESYAARLTKARVFLYNCHISPYEAGNRFNHDPCARGNCSCIKGRSCG